VIKFTFLGKSKFVFCLMILFQSQVAYSQYDSVRYDMTTANVHWNSLTDYNSKGFNPDTLSKPLYCQSETTPTFVANFSKTNSYNSNVAKGTNVLDAGSHYGVAGVYTKKHYNLTTHSVRIKGSFVCRTTTVGDYNEYWLGSIPVSNSNYHPAIYGSGNTPEGYIVGAWVDWWSARSRGTTTQPDYFFVNKINANMPLGLFFEAMAEFRIIHDSLVMTKYTLTPVDDRSKQQTWVYPVYRSTPFEPLKSSPWFNNFRAAFMPDDGLDWVEVVADPLPCSLELKRKSYAACEGSLSPVDLSEFIWLKSQSIDNKTGKFYIRKTTNASAKGYLHKVLADALLPMFLPNGDYTVSYVSPCGDSIQIPIKIIPKPIVNIRDTLLCNQLQFTSKAVVTSKNKINQYYWRFGGNTSLSVQPTWSLIDTGKFVMILSVTDAFGCRGNDTANIEVANIGDLSIGMNDSDQCFEGHSFDFSGNGSSSQNKFYWQLPENKTAEGQSIKSFTVNKSGTFALKLTVVDAWGCRDSAKSQIVLYEKPSIKLRDTSLCAPNQLRPTVIIKSTSPIVFYSWKCGNNFGSTSQPVWNLVDTGRFALILNVSNQNGCKAGDTASVFVSTVGNFDLTVNDSIQCMNGHVFNLEVLNSGNNTTRFTWNLPENKFANGNKVNGFRISAPGKYSVKLKADNVWGCRDSMTSNLVVLESPEIAVFDTQLCLGEWVSIRCTEDFKGSKIVKRRWLANGTDSQIVSPKYLFKTAGQFKLDLIVENEVGCCDTDQAVITVNPKPIINYNFDFANESSGVTHWNYLYTGTSGNKVEWIHKNKLIGLGIGPGTANISDLGTQWVKLRVTTDKGCMDSLEFNKYISISQNIYFPNAFTPDGKGGNNVFGPYNAELLDKYKFMVFNRWGEKLFESSETNRYWDGTDTKGEPAMEGQYVYIVSGVKNTGVFLTHSGTVYLIRN